LLAAAQDLRRCLAAIESQFFSGQSVVETPWRSLPLVTVAAQHITVPPAVLPILARTINHGHQARQAQIGLHSVLLPVADDPALSALLQWSGEIELTLGLAGLAVFVRRRAMADPDAVRTYQHILRLCAGLAVSPQPGQAYWPTAVGSFFRKDSTLVTEVNLGLAHGMPAVLATIIPAVSIPGLSSQASELLSAGCQWLLQQQLPQAESCFPYRAGTGADSRLGWCYGDLSLALLLARAGQVLQNAALLKEARRIALHAAARQQQSARVTDAALCHGSAGLMLQFRLLQQFFPDQALAEAACYWRQLTLQLLPVAIEQLDCGLLNGTAGIGLALLVELGADTVWTEALLLS